MTLSPKDIEAGRDANMSQRATRAIMRRLKKGSLTLHLPMPPNLTNPRNRSHWGAVHGAKQKYYSACDLMQKAGLLPAPPEVPFARVTLSSVMHLGHAMDDDNAMARHKWALDWLKTRGYIAEDTKKHIEWAGIPGQVVKRKQDYTLAITITPITPSRSAVA